MLGAIKYRFRVENRSSDLAVRRGGARNAQQQRAGAKNTPTARVAPRWGVGMGMGLPGSKTSGRTEAGKAAIESSQQDFKRK